MTDIIYSTQRVIQAGSRKTLNPVHFVKPEEGVKNVYVQEGYPHIEDAYARAGAKVHPLKSLPAGGPAASSDTPKKEK